MFTYTVNCGYIAVKLIRISHTTQCWQGLNINETLTPQHTPHTLPSRASYGVWGKLWGVTCEYFGVNGPCYNGTTLYIFRGLSSIFLIDTTPYFPLLVISWLPSLGSWSTFTGLPGWPATYSDVTRPGLIHSDGSNISFMKSLGNYT